MIYRLNAISFSEEMEKPILTFIWNCKKTWIAKTTVKETTKLEESLSLPDFKTYYKTIVLKAVWQYHKDIHRHQWTRTESPEISPNIYGQLISYKSAKTIQWVK